MHILRKIKISKWSWDLSLALAKAEFKLRYEGSYLGVFWYILNPLLTFTLLFLVFATRLGHDIPLYPLYLLLGIIMFNYFQQVTYGATRLIDDNRLIIKSVNFPIWTLVSASVLKFLFSHIFEIVIFFLLTVFLGQNISFFIFYPIIFLFFAIFTFGISLIFATISVFFVDFENVWIFISRLLWFATPIFYEVAGQKQLFIFNLFNPLFYFISLARDLAIYNQMPSWWLLLGGLGYTILALIIGILTFNRFKGKIAEMI